MSEIGETPSPLSTPLELPDISEHAKLAEAAKRKYQSIGSILTQGSFPQEELDMIHFWWSKDANIQKRLSRLESVVSSQEIPELEKEQFKQAYLEFRGKVEPINTQINQLLQKDRLDEKDLEPVVGKIKEAAEGIVRRSQAIALGEAIIETADEDLDEREIRIRIAQGAWEELLNKFSWAKLYYAARSEQTATTEDSLEDQKAELTASLRRKAWGKREVEKNRKIYLGLRKSMKNNKYDQKIIDNFKLVWDTARGVVLEGKSALDILRANELVLRGLYREGAFRWNLEDLEEEGENEEED